MTSLTSVAHKTYISAHCGSDAPAAANFITMITACQEITARIQKGLFSSHELESFS
jgi:hypothetical protein